MKKRSNSSTGPVPIYMRITLDGKRSEISCKRSCPDPEKWISSAGCMSGTKESVRTLNAHLDALQNEVFEIYKTLLQTESVITAEIIKAHLTGTV